MPAPASAPAPKPHIPKPVLAHQPPSPPARPPPKLQEKPQHPTPPLERPGPGPKPVTHNQEKPPLAPQHKESIYKESHKELPKPSGEVLEGEVLTRAPKQAPKQEPKQTAPAPEKAAEPEFAEEREGFSAQIDEFLQELNLSRKHLIIGIGCLILLVALIFGGIAGFKYYKKRKGEAPTPPPPTTEISGEDTGIPQTGDIGKVRILSPADIGETGLSSLIGIGTEGASFTRIAGYIMAFRRLQNAYGTDINELLNKATDRRARLRGHLALLRNLQSEGEEYLKTIRAEIEAIKVIYEPERQRQDETDINFFEQLSALNSQTAEDILDEFILVSQRVIAFRARFKALQKIAALYEEALPKMINRIRDIELNEEALVSGIKVYDVKGSDLELILPANGGSVKEEEKLSSPAIPFLPVHPAKVDTGKDFITVPGGGF